MNHHVDRDPEKHPTKASDQYELGLRYLKGNGVPQSDIQAAFWIEVAAEQGHHQAILMMIKLYWSGVGLPKSHKHAFFWMLKAHENGDLAATQSLVAFHMKGHLVFDNPEMAIELYQVALSKGYDTKHFMREEPLPTNPPNTSKSFKAIHEANLAIFDGDLDGHVRKEALSRTMTKKQFTAANDASMAKLYSSQ